MFSGQPLQGKLEPAKSALLVGDDPVQLVNGIVLVSQADFQVVEAFLLIHIDGPGLVFGVIFGIMSGFAVVNSGHFKARRIELEALMQHYFETPAAAAFTGLLKISRLPMVTA